MTAAPSAIMYFVNILISCLLHAPCWCAIPSSKPREGGVNQPDVPALFMTRAAQTTRMAPWIARFQGVLHWWRGDACVPGLKDRVVPEREQRRNSPGFLVGT